MRPASSDEQLDAITVIENDHRVVDGLFDTYERLGRDGDPAERQRTVRSMIDELRLHASMEEHVFYPAVQEALDEEGGELVEAALLEHAEAKETLDEIEALDVSSDGFHERVTALIEEVRHHVDEEEQEILPKLREALDSQVLLQLGGELESAKLTLLGVPSTGEGGAEEGVVIGDAKRSGGRRRTTAKKTATVRKTSAKKTSAKKTTAKKTSSPKTSAKKTSANRRGATKVTSGRASTARLVYHVKPTQSGRWSVAKRGAARPSATFDRKTEAVARGKELAKRPSRGQLVVHGLDGKVQGEFTYGDDPRRTKN
jgi:hemerythrin superfamily protein